MLCSKITYRCVGVHSCCQEHLLEMLDAVTTVLKDNNIKCWLNFGTLLGAVRDQNIIPWDEDVDLGIMEDDVDKILRVFSGTDMKGYQFSKHFIPKVEGGQRVCSVTIQYSAINSLHMCLNTFAIKGRLWRGVEWQGMKFPLGSIDNLATGIIRGKQYPIPSNPEFGLRRFYGRDWRTPKIKSWIKNFVYSDGNIDPKLDAQIKRLEVYVYEPGRHSKRIENPEIT